MSASAFVALFKDRNSEEGRLYREWKAKNNTWINLNREQLVARGLSKRVGFVLDSAVVGTLGDEAKDKFAKLVEELKSSNKTSRRGPFVTNVDGKDVVLFPGVSFEKGIYSTIEKYLGKTALENTKKNELVRGHVYGINTGALLGVRESLLASKALSSKDKDTKEGILKFLDILINHLEKMDIESSNLKSYNDKIFGRYTKSSRHFLVELQTKASNDESAQLVQKLSGRTKEASTGIRGIFNPGGTQAKAVEALLPILEAQGFTSEQVIEFKGSPSMKELIAEDISNAISGKNIPSKTYSLNNIEVKTYVKGYVDKKGQSDYLSQLRAIKSQLKAARTKVAQQKVKAIPPLSSLQAIINTSLFERIRANMGTGNDAKILNYRTGRLAASATVERMSVSREGMITAFYSYMKNPYATFSSGGRQEYPTSRDPKLLISKSIREIAATSVANRLRAVNV